MDFEDIQQMIDMLADNYCKMAERASDIAYARRRLFEAYLMEGFNPQQALELCKIL